MWSLLTTCLHYASDDTCLHIGGSSSSKHITPQFYVTVSSPASLSIRERDAYMNALNATDDNVHMFSYTMAQYPNFQLATRLAQALGGEVSYLAEGEYRCVLQLILPYSSSP
jgi:hypothetical protein